MSVTFRNVEVASDDVEQWPYEAIVITLERGTIGDWALLTRAIGASPWGEVARQVEDYLGYADEPDVASLLRRRIARARAEAERRERDDVAATVRAYVRRSGLARETFARRVGTSRTRLSTYCAGKVTPSAALLLRMSRVPSPAVDGDVEGRADFSHPGIGRAAEPFGQHGNRD
ncbi:MAG: helix-turn-helix transcriptional regulator [Actinomycetota bacterium]|nr:helix-turn-helix transcriptional regulator [Actinomycetota bacterium]